MRIWNFVSILCILHIINNRVVKVHSLDSAVLKPSIEYYRIGPHIACPEGIAAINNYFDTNNESINQTINQTIDRSIDYSHLPVFTLGLTLSLTGFNEEKKSADFDVPIVLQLLLDWINSRGGISIDPSIKQSNHSSNYLISILYADDQSSPLMARLIFADLIDQGIQLFMGSFGDDTQLEINALIRSIDRTLTPVTIVTGVAFERETFDTQLTGQEANQSANQESSPSINQLFSTSDSDQVDQPIDDSIYLFGVRGSADLYLPRTLNRLDDEIREDQFQNQLNNKAANDRSDRTANDMFVRSKMPGIQTICMFTPATSLGMKLRQGVLSWIESTNQSNNRSVTLLVDTVVDQSINQVDMPLYLEDWLSCPSDTDLVLMPYSVTAALALSQSRRRFGAVLDFNQLTTSFYQLISSTISAGWIHWMSITSLTEPIGFMIPSPLEFAGMYASYTSVINQLNNQSNYPSNYQYPVSQFIDHPYAYSRLLALSFVFSAFNRSINQSNNQPTNQSFPSTTNQTINQSAMDHSAFRRSMLSLTTTTLMGTTLFDQSNGLNIGLLSDQYTLFQVVRNGSIIVDQSIEFPYDWSWPKPSSARFIDQDAAVCMFAAITGGIGTWITFLLFEQSLLKPTSKLKQNHSFRRFCMYQFLCACVLSLVAILTTQVLLAISVTVRATDEISNDYHSNMFRMFMIIEPASICLAGVLFSFFMISDSFPTMWRRGMRRLKRLRPIRITSVSPRHSVDPSVTQSVSRSNHMSVSSSVKPVINTLNRARSTEAARREREQNQSALASSLWRELLHLTKIALQPRLLIASLGLVFTLQSSRVKIYDSWRLGCTISTPHIVWAIATLLNGCFWAVCLSCLRHGFKWRIPAVFLATGLIIADWEVHMWSSSFVYNASESLNRSIVSYDYAFTTDVVVFTVLLISIFLDLIALAALFGGMITSHKALRAVVAATEAELIRAVDRKARSEMELKEMRIFMTSMFAMLQSITLSIHCPQEYALPLALYHGQTSSPSTANTSALMKVRRLLRRDTPASKGTEGFTSPIRSSILQFGTPHPPLRSIRRKTMPRTGSERSLTNVMQHQSSDLTIDTLSLPHRGSHRLSNVHHLPPIPQRRSLQTSHMNMNLHVTAPRSVTSRPSSMPSRNPASPPRSPDITPASAPLPIATDTFSVNQSINQPINHSSKARDSVGSPPFASRVLRSSTLTSSYVQENLAVAESLTVNALEAQASSAVWSDVKFSFSKPLTGPRNDTDGLIPQLSLSQILSHPVCVELFKQETIKYHSLENLSFFLIAHRYRSLVSARVRKFVAHKLFVQFIEANSPEEINISTSQRRAIELNIKHNMYEWDLFAEAERECFHLMEVNIFEKFSKESNPNYRLACWLYATISVPRYSWLSSDFYQMIAKDSPGITSDSPRTPKRLRL